MKESCVVKAVIKAPEQLSEEDEAEDCGLSDRYLLDRSDQLAQGDGVSPSDRDAKKDDPCSLSVYYHEGGELFADDIEQHMAVLLEVATSSTEITIDDVQV